MQRFVVRIDGPQYGNQRIGKLTDTESEARRYAAQSEKGG